MKRIPACKSRPLNALFSFSAESVMRLVALRRISDTERISSSVIASSFAFHPSSVGSRSFSTLRH